MFYPEVGGVKIILIIYNLTCDKACCVRLLQWSFSRIESVKHKGTPSICRGMPMAGRNWHRPPYLHKTSYTFSNEWSWRWQFELSHPVCQRYGTISITARASWFCSSLGFWVSQAAIRQCLPSCGRFNFQWREAKEARCSQHPYCRRPNWLLSYTMKVHLLFSASRTGGDKEKGGKRKSSFYFFL